jgi:hypothetical protein
VQVQVEVAQDVAPPVVFVAGLRQETVRGIGKRDVVELDVPFAVDQVDCVRPVDNGRLLVQDLLDALG